MGCMECGIKKNEVSRKKRAGDADVPRRPRTPVGYAGGHGKVRIQIVEKGKGLWLSLLT